MSTKRTWTFALLAAALTVTLAASSLVHGKGKPKPPPEPDPPPIEYHLTWLPNHLGTLYIEQMNDAGDIVGYYFSGGHTDRFLYQTSPTPSLINLNALLPADSDWILRSATDINAFGQVVGRGLFGDDGEQHAYRFTPSDGTNPAIIEDIGTTDSAHVSSEATAINFWGDVGVRIWKTDGFDYAYVWMDPLAPEEGDPPASPVLVEITGNTPGSIRINDLNDFGQLLCRNFTSDGNTSNYYNFRYTPGVGEERVQSQTALSFE